MQRVRGRTFNRNSKEGTKSNSLLEIRPKVGYNFSPKTSKTAVILRF
jgi:hypothetical protein